MKTNLLKLSIIAGFVLGTFALLSLHDTPTRVSAAREDDPAAVYKAKCVACHTAKAEKWYNPDLPLEEQVNAILKGKKGEKPPFMPGYETKGITPEQAKALAEYMISLRKPAETKTNTQ